MNRDTPRSNRILRFSWLAVALVMIGGLLYLTFFPPRAQPPPPIASLPENATSDVSSDIPPITDPPQAAGPLGQTGQSADDSSSPRPATHIDSIWVQVLDESSQPVPEARLTVTDSVTGLKESAASDSRGLACFTSIAEGIADFTHAGPWSLSAESDGYFPARREISASQLSPGVPAVITLLKKWAIAGTVVTGEGRPVPGIAVIRSVSEAEPHYDGIASAQVDSSTDGSFRFYPLPGGSYILHVSDTYWMAQDRTIQAGDEQARMVVSGEAVLQAMVESVRQEKVPAARVTVTSDAKEEFRYAAEAVTDIRGGSVFTGLRRGNYQLLAKHDWYQDSEPQAVEIQQATQVMKVVLADREYSISGYVLDEQTKQGVPNAPVVCMQEPHITAKGIASVTRSVITDEKGFFQFDALHGGIYVLYVDRMKGYLSGPVPEYTRYGIAPPARIPLGQEPRVDNVILWLKKSWSISGHVYDAESRQPLPDLSVELHLSFRSRALGQYHTTSSGNRLDEAQTDNEGFYRVTGPLEIAEQRHTVYVMTKTKGYKRNISDDYRPQPGEEITNVDLYLEKGSMVEGLVTDTEGNAIADAGVVFWGEETSKSPLQSNPRETQTGMDGSYWIVLEPGVYLGRAFAEGYNRSDHQSEPRRIELPDTQSNRIENFVLEKGGDVIQGMVTNNEQHPLPEISISVHLSHEQGGGAFRNNVAVTNEDGRFHIDLSSIPMYSESTSIAVGAIENREYETAYMINVNPSQFVHLVMNEKAAEGGIEGWVLSPQGQPVMDYDLVVIPSGGFNYNVRNLYFFSPVLHPSFSWNHIRNPEGKFLIVDLPLSGNPYRIAARTSTNPTTYSEPIRIPEKNIAAGIQLILQPGASIAGEVWFGDPAGGAPGADSEVIFQPTLPGPVSFADIGRVRDRIGTPLKEMGSPTINQAGPDGRFLLEGISPQGGHLSIRLNEYSLEIPIPPIEGSGILDLGQLWLTNTNMGEEP